MNETPIHRVVLFKVIVEHIPMKFRCGKNRSRPIESTVFPNPRFFEPPKKACPQFPSSRIFKGEEPAPSLAFCSFSTRPGIKAVLLIVNALWYVSRSKREALRPSSRRVQTSTKLRPWVKFSLVILVPTLSNILTKNKENSESILVAAY